jgi:hypothetical protein
MRLHGPRVTCAEEDGLILADGTRLLLRPLSAGDRAGLSALFAWLTPEFHARGSDGGVTDLELELNSTRARRLCTQAGWSGARQRPRAGRELTRSTPYPERGHARLIESLRHRATPRGARVVRAAARTAARGASCCLPRPGCVRCTPGCSETELSRLARPQRGNAPGTPSQRSCGNTRA